MRCKVCLDERVQDVDAALAAGRSAHSLAVEFGLPPESMKRHARSHARRFDAPVNRPGTDPLVELTTALRTPALGATRPRHASTASRSTPSRRRAPSGPPTTS